MDWISFFTGVAATVILGVVLAVIFADAEKTADFFDPINDDKDDNA